MCVAFFNEHIIAVKRKILLFIFSNHFAMRFRSRAMTLLGETPLN